MYIHYIIHCYSLGEYNELDNKIPESTEFNFVPKLLPHQKLFNVNTDPSSWSASALTQRYQWLLREKKKHKPLFSSSKDPSTSNTSTPTTVSYHGHDPSHGHGPPHDLSLNDYIYHRTLSITIITYIQLIFRVIILSILLYIVFHLIWTIQEDFQIKANDYTNSKYLFK